jgi:exonuclease III
MSFLSWNCRGLGNPRAIRDLHQMVKEKGPSMVFLMETKICNKDMDFLRIKLKFDYIFVVNSVGRSGGLIILWKDDIKIDIQNYSRRHINAIISRGRDGTEWKFFGIYGNPETAKRKETWALMRHLATFSPKPWLCMGDFNEIINLSEKWGAITRANGQMEAFRRTLEDCQLCDLGYKGEKYTWNNGRHGAQFTKERLDRVVANSEWRKLYDAMEVEVLANRSSDHHPILVKLNEHKNFARKKERLFRMEAAWSLRPDFKEAVLSGWATSTNAENGWATVKRKMGKCKRTIQVWVRKNVGAVEDLIKSKTKKLEVIQKGAVGNNREEEKTLRGEIDGLLEQEEIKWRQRANEEWLKNGDRNTKYFHACATQRRRKNMIDQILDGGGQTCNTAESIEDAFVRYYADLFTSASPVNLEACISAINSKVTTVMNGNLTADFTREEVKNALDQMAPNKAPGPDGFTAGFYQQHWDTVGSEVCEAALYFFKNISMDQDINSTNIALIPKKQTPVSVTEFRPISLCNVLYKIISKVLANKFKKVLPTIISPYQSAFLSGRLITDNILAAYETMHSMHTKMWSKVGFIDIKLDMSKVYDRVKWAFLEAVMTKLGFATRWIKMVMECIRTVKYSIVVNGNPVGNIIPTRGLKQGDPLSPYLFILCAEALSCMLTHVEAK